MIQPAPHKSPKAQAFIMANRRSPVLAGSAVRGGGAGALYRLENGQSFQLTRAECEQVGQFRWKRG